MKTNHKRIQKITATWMLVFLSHLFFSQNQFFRIPEAVRGEIRGKYERIIKKESLKRANSIDDMINGFPKNWISQYKSVQITASCNGRSKQAESKNNVLNSEQKNLLSQLEAGSSLTVNVQYQQQDPQTKKTETNNIHVVLHVVPEVEPAFYGGEKVLEHYLQTNILNYISEKIPKPFQHGLFDFSINQQGEVINIKTARSTGDLKTDEKIMHLLEKMPKWRPAENANGSKVVHEMQFSFGNDGC